MQYQPAKDPDVSPHDQRPQLETGHMAPAQHGCSEGAQDWTCPWDRDSHKGSNGLFLFPHPLFCVLSCMTLPLQIHAKRLW